MRYASISLRISMMVLVLGLPRIALAVDMNDFKATYHAYLKAVDEKDWATALSLSKKSLDQGLLVFVKNGQNVANLRENYARELNRAGRRDEAVKQLEQSLEANEAMHGRYSEDLLGPLMDLGDTLAATDAAAANKDFAQAVRIARRAHHQALEAKLEFEAGLLLAKHEHFDDAKHYLEDAHAFYLRSFGPKDARAGIAALNLGNIYALEHRNKDARKLLVSALAAFTGKDPVSTQFDASTRRVLVPVLEAMGRDDEAISHCIAIAMDNAAGGSAEPELLYRNDQRAEPGIRTRQGAGKQIINPNGEVDLAYTVDATGRPVDIAVQATDNPTLNDTAIDFVKTFRYAPAISNGKPVATQGVEFHYRTRPPVPVEVEQ